MSRHTVLWGSICCGIMWGLLVVGTADAQSGGLPQCKASLSTCTSRLGTCQMDLAACQAEPTVVFPGDGAGHGAALSYTNHGNGTVTDNNTLLLWEVKDNAGGVHDVDNTYTWTADGSSGTAANGTLFTEFLSTLNNKCDGDETTACTSNADCTGIGLCGHAGFRDWRIPHVKELQSIVHYGVLDPPFIHPTFPGQTATPGQTAASNYWSSTVTPGGPMGAWDVRFLSGAVSGSNKALLLHARAVRGGQ